MPQPPRPGGMRAMMSFPLGMVVMLVIVGIIRHFFQGIDAFLVPVKLLDGFFAGWFWEDQATFMFSLLGGALGFMWGAGAVHDFSKDEVPTKAIKRRIPVDPDAPLDPGRNLIAPLFEALPSIGVVIVIMIVVLILIGAIPVINLGAGQTTNEAANVGEFGEGDFNLLGIVKFEQTNQAVLFIGFAVIVIGTIVATGGLIGLIFFLLNRQVNTAAASKPDPQEGQAFLPIRLVAFFTDWVLDVLNGFKAGIRPR